MAGQAVVRVDLDNRMAGALVSARNAIADLETINAFLDRNPVGDDGVDPLTVPVAEGGTFGYEADEALLIRTTFRQFAQMKPTIAPLLDNARGLTGLL